MPRLLFFALLSATLAAAEPQYRAVPEWPTLPKEHVMGLCAGVGVDARNRVFVFHRSGREWQKQFPTEPIAAPTVSVLDGVSGKLLDAWGAGRFIMPHGLSTDSQGNVWLTDIGLQQVFKFTPDGILLLTLGERFKPGNDSTHFDFPTDIATLPDGSFYVSDGYRNTRVMKFSADGTFEFQWGTKGKEAGQFNLPHGIATDAQGRVYVCDRSNSRLHVFDAKGNFMDEWKGSQIGRPYGVAVSSEGHVLIIDGGEPKLHVADRDKVVELDAKGAVLASFGSYGSAPGQFQVGHDIAVGPDGAVYVAEGNGKRVQKFARAK